MRLVTCLGEGLLVFVPSPSCPWSLYPQAQAASFWPMARAWLAPALICAALKVLLLFAGSGTGAGSAAYVVLYSPVAVPLPSCP